MPHETDREDPKQVRPTQHAGTHPGQKGGKGKAGGMQDDLDEARGVADQKGDDEESDSDSSTSSRSGQSGSEHSTGQSGKGEKERGGHRTGGGSSPSGGGSAPRPNQR